MSAAAERCPTNVAIGLEPCVDFRFGKAIEEEWDAEVTQYMSCAASRECNYIRTGIIRPELRRRSLIPDI